MPEEQNNEDKPLSQSASRLTKTQRWANFSASVLLALHRVAMLGQWIWSFFNDLPT